MTISKRFSSEQSRLITEILFSASWEEVQEHIKGTFVNIERERPDMDALSNFTNGVMEELARFNPLDEQAQQWSNIKLARIIFLRIRQELEKRRAGSITADA